MLYLLENSFDMTDAETC